MVRIGRSIVGRRVTLANINNTTDQEFLGCAPPIAARLPWHDRFIVGQDMRTARTNGCTCHAGKRSLLRIRCDRPKAPAKTMGPA